MKNQKLINSKNNPLFTLICHKIPEFRRVIFCCKRNGYSLAGLINLRWFLTFYQHCMKHALNAQVATVDKAKSCKSINQLRVPGYRAVVENILRRNSTDKPASTIDFNPIRKMFNKNRPGNSIVGMTKRIHNCFPQSNFRIGPIFKMKQPLFNGCNRIIRHDPINYFHNRNRNSRISVYSVGVFRIGTHFQKCPYITWKVLFYRRFLSG